MNVNMYRNTFFLGVSWILKIHDEVLYSGIPSYKTIFALIFVVLFQLKRIHI